MPRNADSAPAFLPRDEDRARASHFRSSVLAPDRPRKYSLPARSVLFLLAQGAQDIFQTPPFLKIGKLAVHFDRPTPIPLADGGQFEASGRGLRLNQFGVDQGKKFSPLKM